MSLAGQIIVVVLAIYLGIRYQGLALGLFGALGLAILTSCYNLPVAPPPTDVILIILAVITATSCMHSAGGLDYLVHQAVKILHKKPQHVAILGPIIAYLFTLLAGTGHIVYSLLPIISELSIQTKVRPERAIAMSVVSSQIAISASPLSAATVSVVGLLAGYEIGLANILAITIPSTSFAVILGAFLFRNIGKDFDKDPMISRNLKSKSETNEAHSPYRTDEKRAKVSLAYYLLAISLIVFLGVFPEMRPQASLGNKLSVLPMSDMIALIMLVCGACIIVHCKLRGPQITQSSIFSAGVQAVIAIFGIAWLGNSFVSFYLEDIKILTADLIYSFPEVFTLMVFLISIPLYSQAATLRALLPLGIGLGLPGYVLISCLPAANGLFFIPNYPTVIAAMQFDRTGSTRVGKYVLNHSFMLPGLFTTGIAVILSSILGYIVLGT